MRQRKGRHAVITGGRTLVRTAFIFFFVGAPIPVFAQSTAAQFLSIPGIQGEATALGHEKWIELVSVGQTLRPNKVTGVYCRTVLVKRIDTASPKLWAAASAAQSFAEMTIETVRNDAVILRETLTDVQLRRADFLDQRPDPNGLSSEAIVLIPHAVTLRYTEIDQQGQPVSNVEETFSCAAN